MKYLGYKYNNVELTTNNMLNDNPLNFHVTWNCRFERKDDDSMLDYPSGN